MNKYILIILIVFLTTFSFSQFLCNISPKVKEAGDIITKGKSNSSDVLIIGDYRMNGSGWVLLPDHTGGFFIENVQSNEILWVLGDINGNIGIEITTFKNELNYQNKLQIESQNKFLVNFISESKVEFVNTHTSEL